MNILGNDIRPIEPDFIAEYRIQMTTLDDPLARADYVSVNVDLHPASHHLITTTTLAKMKSTAVLINSARGPIVDE